MSGFFQPPPPAPTEEAQGGDAPPWAGRPQDCPRSGKRAYLFGLSIENGWLSHEGEIPGYNTEIAYLPSLKASIVVIANSDVSDTKLINPAPAIFKALARVIAPRNVPTG